MKILIVKLHAIGDVVMITPAIRRLKQSFPDSQVDIVIGEWSAQSVQYDPHFKRVITCPDGWFSWKSPWNVVRLAGLLRRLRANCYDAVLVFHHHRAIRQFAAMISAPVTMAYHPVFDDSERFSLWDTERHGVRNATALVNAFCRQMGVDTIPDDDDQQLKAEWVVTEEEIVRAKDILVTVGIDEPPIVIHPGAGGSPRGPADERKWSTTRFAQLIELLRQRGFGTVVIGGMDFETPLAQSIQSQANSPVVSIAGMTNLREMAAVLTQSRLLITNDTGVMHVGGAVGVPLVGIFGPTGYSNKLPLGGSFKAVQSTLPCSPCTYGAFRGCLYDEIECMKEITAQRVLETSLSLL